MPGPNHANFENKAMSESEFYSQSSSVLWLTQEGYRSLQQELEHLTLVKRPEIADRIRESLQHGEFSEDNSELDEVKFEQAMVETRVSELKSIFGNAQVLDTDKILSDKVGLGNYVKVLDIQFSEEFEVRIVSSIEADPNEDLISNESPMGIALCGRSEGETVDFVAPEGSKQYRIVSIRK
jgi:transcription elongation factor GreA